jgi:hypothetical protein
MDTSTRHYRHKDRFGESMLTITVNWPLLARFAGPRAMRNQSRKASLLNGAIRVSLSPAKD